MKSMKLIGLLLFVLRGLSCVFGEKSDEKLGSIRPFVINGSDAPLGRFPYIVSLQSVETLSHFCAGSLVAPDVVLSAAHCYRSKIAIRITPYRLRDPVPSSVILESSTIVLHPLYAIATPNDYDVMLVRLNGTVDTTLLTLNQDATVPTNGQDLTVMGWGLTTPNGNSLSNTLQVTDKHVVAVTNKQCVNITMVYHGRDSYEGQVTGNMLCAIEDNTGPCDGDSGGPLIVPGSDSSQDVQVGIVSWGFECGLFSYPGVYSRVSWIYPYIRENVCQLSRRPPDSFRCSELPSSSPSVSPAPTTTTVAITVLLDLDFAPFETGWRIYSSEGTLVRRVFRGQYLDRDAVVSETLRVTLGASYVLEIVDRTGSGAGFCVFLGDAIDYSRVLLRVAGNSYRREFAATFTASPSAILPLPLPTASPTKSPAPSFMPTTTSQPTNQLVSVTVLIDFDTYPVETSWTMTQITNDSDEVLVGNGGPYSPFVGDNVTHILQLESRMTYNLTVFDTRVNAFGFPLAGNGLCCGFGFGAVFVYLGTRVMEDRVLVYDDGRFGDARSHLFVPESNRTFLVTPSPSAAPSVSLAPSTSASPTVPSRNVLLFVRSGFRPAETSLEVVDATTGAVVIAIPSLDQPLQETPMIIRLLFNRPYFLVVRDTFGDGICCGGFVAVYFGTDDLSSNLLAHVSGNFGFVSNQTFVVSLDAALVPTSTPSITTNPSETIRPSDAPSVVPPFPPTTSPSFVPVDEPEATSEPSTGTTPMTTSPPTSAATSAATSQFRTLLTRPLVAFAFVAIVFLL